MAKKENDDWLLLLLLLGLGLTGRGLGLTPSGEPSPRPPTDTGSGRPNDKNQDMPPSMTGGGVTDKSPPITPFGVPPSNEKTGMMSTISTMLGNALNAAKDKVINMINPVAPTGGEVIGANLVYVPNLDIYGGMTGNPNPYSPSVSSRYGDVTYTNFNAQALSDQLLQANLARLMSLGITPPNPEITVKQPVPPMSNPPMMTPLSSLGFSLVDRNTIGVGLPAPAPLPPQPVKPSALASPTGISQSYPDVTIPNPLPMKMGLSLAEIAKQFGSVGSGVLDLFNFVGGLFYQKQPTPVVIGGVPIITNPLAVVP